MHWHCQHSKGVGYALGTARDFLLWCYTCIILLKVVQSRGDLVDLTEFNQWVCRKAPRVVMTTPDD